MLNHNPDLTQFGVPLNLVLSRYGEHLIPRLLKEMVVILFQCVEIVDIFRLVVNKAELNEIIHEINTTFSSNFTNLLSPLNPHIVANLLLAYLDQIPGGLIAIPRLDCDLEWLSRNKAHVLGPKPTVNASNNHSAAPSGNALQNSASHGAIMSTSSGVSLTSGVPSSGVGVGWNETQEAKDFAQLRRRMHSLDTCQAEFEARNRKYAAKILHVLLALLLHFDKARVPGMDIASLAVIFGPAVVKFADVSGPHTTQSSEKAILIFEAYCKEELEGENGANPLLGKEEPKKRLLFQKELLPITQQRIHVEALRDTQEEMLKAYKSALGSLKNAVKLAGNANTPEELDALIKSASSQFYADTCFRVEAKHVPTILESKLNVFSGHISEQGKRKSMEDAVVHFDDFNAVAPFLLPTCGRGLWAVYDGHGGVAESKTIAVCNTPVWVQDRHHIDVAYYLAQSLQTMNASGETLHRHILEALRKAVIRTDKYIAQGLQRIGDKSGSTSVLAYLQDTTLYISNLGDSECVMGTLTPGPINDSQGPRASDQLERNPNEPKSYARAKLLSFPHKPDGERKRIEELGGTVVNGRLNGLLGVSRAFGDIAFKRDWKHISEYLVSIDPFLASYELNPNDKFIILACDGLWDVMSYQYAVDFTAFRLDRGELPEAIAEALVDKALNELKSQDNVSCVIVSFKWSATSSHYQPPVVSPFGNLSAKDSTLVTTMSQSM